MTSDEKLLEAIAAELCAIFNPKWPKRWGWTEIPEPTKAIYRKDAERIVKIVKSFPTDD